VRDIVEVGAQLERCGATLLGPNCPGVVSPGMSNVGIMPADIFRSGPVGLVSRSGTLTYLIVSELSRAGLGQSTCVGIGGDAVHGLGFIECLVRFEADPQTAAVVLIGEIGGDDEDALPPLRRQVPVGRHRVVAAPAQSLRQTLCACPADGLPDLPHAENRQEAKSPPRSH
jgi:succinyl-CoA synthetase alpha subunit